MANRNFKRVQALENELKIITGIFSTDTGVPTKVAGTGFTIGGGAGEYEILLDDHYPALISVQLTVEVPDGNDVQANVASYDVVGNKLIGLNTVDNLGDIVATDCAVHFAIFLRNSTVV